MLDLDAIEARAEAATPGPWTARLSDMWEINAGSDLVSVVESCWLPDDCEAGQHGGIPDVDDARFIAHARTDVPALVAELRAAREVVEAALDVASPYRKAVVRASLAEMKYTPMVNLVAALDALEKL